MDVPEWETRFICSTVDYPAYIRLCQEHNVAHMGDVPVRVRSEAEYDEIKYGIIGCGDTMANEYVTRSEWSRERLLEREEAGKANAGIIELKAEYRGMREDITELKKSQRETYELAIQIDSALNNGIKEVVRDHDEWIKEHDKKPGASGPSRLTIFLQRLAEVAVIVTILAVAFVLIVSLVLGKLEGADILNTISNAVGKAAP